MKKLLLICMVISQVTILFAQSKHTSYSGGLIIPQPAYFPATQTRNAISARLINHIEGFGTPESNDLQNGGYGIWALKLAYVF